MMIRMGISAEMEERTVLDGAPQVLRDLTEYRANLSQQLVDNPVLGALLKVLESVLEEDEASQSKDKEDGREIAYLHDERSSLMACKRDLLAVEGLVAAGRRRVRIGVDERGGGGTTRRSAAPVRSTRAP
jgi:hypothetical protein